MLLLYPGQGYSGSNEYNATWKEGESITGPHAHTFTYLFMLIDNFEKPVLLLTSLGDITITKILLFIGVCLRNMDIFLLFHKLLTFSPNSTQNSIT